MPIVSLRSTPAASQRIPCFKDDTRAAIHHHHFPWAFALGTEIPGTARQIGERYPATSPLGLHPRVRRQPQRRRGAHRGGPAAPSLRCTPTRTQSGIGKDNLTAFRFDLQHVATSQTGSPPPQRATTNDAIARNRIRDQTVVVNSRRPTGGDVPQTHPDAVTYVTCARNSGPRTSQRSFHDRHTLRNQQCVPSRRGSSQTRNRPRINIAQPNPRPLRVRARRCPARRVRPVL